MTEDKLRQLKRLVEEDDQNTISPPCEQNCPGCPGAQPISTRTMTDEQLAGFLACEGGDVMRAAYKVLIYKSKASDITLSSGLRLPDQSEHYLRLARLYRPNAGGILARADDPIRYEGRRESGCL